MEKECTGNGAGADGVDGCLSGEYKGGVGEVGEGS